MADERRHFQPREIVSILRQHLLEHVPVSDLCERHKLAPSVFYRWLKRFFEEGAALFERHDDSRTRQLEAQNTALRTKLAHKDEVIAEIMESHVALKKTLGQA